MLSSDGLLSCEIPIRFLTHINLSSLVTAAKARDEKKGGSGTDGGVGDIEGWPLAIPGEDEIEEIDDVAVENAVCEVAEHSGYKQGVAREGEIQCGLGSSMLVPILLPGRGVAFVVVAVLDAPVTSDGLGGTGLVFLHRQAGEEDAGVALEGLGGFFLAPVALHGNGATGAG